jgi:type III restriction enzyme
VDPATGLFQPEHVNIFGIPFTFLPHEGGDEVVPPPPAPNRASSLWPKRAVRDHVAQRRPHEHTWTPRLALTGKRAGASSRSVGHRHSPSSPPWWRQADVSASGDRLDDPARHARDDFSLTARDEFDQMAPIWTAAARSPPPSLVALVERSSPPIAWRSPQLFNRTPAAGVSCSR